MFFNKKPIFKKPRTFEIKKTFETTKILAFCPQETTFILFLEFQFLFLILETTQSNLDAYKFVTCMFYMPNVMLEH